MSKKLTSTIELLQKIAREYQPAVFAHSFGAEDMLLLDLIERHQLPIEVFSLDTGRLPQETYSLMERSGQRYPSIPIRVYFPQAEAVQGYVNQHGINGFYQSVELRKACCAVRKLEPLRRALSGKQAWITGLRREQSVTRGDMAAQEWDEAHAMHKFNPLLDWTEAEVWAYIRSQQVPYNELHDRFYPSIGCAPCTRSIAMGEDVRAGRWWWENPEFKECGLHVKP